TWGEAFDYTWRERAVQADWVFERTRGASVARDRQASQKSDGSVDHRFQLQEGEEEATWTVHAFARHSFFRPTHLEPTQVQVKTEKKRLAEMRAESFAGLGQPAIVDEKHDFDTSLYNEAFGDDKYDKGRLLRGDLPADFQRRTPKQRLATLDAEIGKQNDLLTYLRKDGTHPEAIAAAEHYLAKLRDARAAMESDDKSGWKQIEIRGFFLGNESQAADGPLDLYAAVNFTEFDGMPLIQVQIRDLSRRLGADNYRFEGIGDKFQIALERAFIDLCKKYPAGRVSVLAEELDPSGLAPTGKTVGFELHTGSAWKSTKEVVFDPVVNVAVNVGSAVVMIFVPASIPVLLPLTIAYNATQTVDQMVDEWTSGTLTRGHLALGVAQIGLDVLPLIGRARAIQSSTRAFYLLEGVQWAGQAVVMTVAAQEQIKALRDNDIAGMAEVYVKLVEAERKTHASDPALAKMRAEIAEKEKAIRARTAEVWNELVTQQAIALIPIKAATHLERHMTGVRIEQLGKRGMFEQAEGVEPRYDRASGRIVGDEKHLNLSAIERLTAEQDAHMRELAGELAGQLGVERQRVVIKPDNEMAIWDDGVDIQVRYTPGTDPKAALETWKKQARAAHIGGPRTGPTRPRGARPADSTPSETATGGRRRPAATERPADKEPPEVRVRDREGVIPDELEESGDIDSRATTAAPVPGSSFRGRAGTPEPDAVKAAAQTAMQATAGRVKGVVAVERIASDHIANRTARAQAADTYLVTLQDGPPITIRIAAGPLEGELVARTILNPTKTGASKVSRTAPDGTTAAMDVTVEGRYVVQVSDTVDAAHAERAVAHEVAEILAERALAKSGKVRGRDALVPGAAMPGAELSPHDLGRIAEFNSLAARARAGG
ncbi:MAG TPA: hypothetical protein VEL05_06350, partial [Candidatus Acidoferrum sp.]|nr:hypothetical protein [Candidatus Acidoferrum sp.]